MRSSLVLFITLLGFFSEIHGQGLSPTNPGVINRVLSNYGFTAAKLTDFKTAFNKNDTFLVKYQVVNNLLAGITNATKKAKVQKTLLELMDFVFYKTLTDNQLIVMIYQPLATAGTWNNFVADLQAVDTKYKGDLILSNADNAKAMKKYLPSASNAALWTQIQNLTDNDPYKSQQKRVFQFSHWNGKNTSTAYYFNAKGYVRAKAPWETYIGV